MGRADLIERLRSHPMYRAMRLDKLQLAGLETTLRMYREGRGAEIPVRAMLAKTAEDCALLGKEYREKFRVQFWKKMWAIPVAGPCPREGLPTTVVAIRGGDVEAWSAALRRGEPAIVARVARDALIIDPRTLLPGDAERLIEKVNRVISAQ